MRRACRDAIAVFPVPDEFPRRTEWIAEEEIEVEAISGCTARGGTRVRTAREQLEFGQGICCGIFCVSGIVFLSAIVSGSWWFIGLGGIGVLGPICAGGLIQWAYALKPSEATERGSE